MTVERAAELLSAARRGVAFTGAGASAESGIPTFRGAGGLWTKYDPVKVASIDSFMQDPTAYWMVCEGARWDRAGRTTQPWPLGAGGARGRRRSGGDSDAEHRWAPPGLG